jgi:hypothetical protein
MVPKLLRIYDVVVSDLVGRLRISTTIGRRVLDVFQHIRGTRLVVRLQLDPY